MATIIVYISSVSGNLEVCAFSKSISAYVGIFIGEEEPAKDWGDIAEELQRERGQVHRRGGRRRCQEKDARLEW